jgi:hypothetical protein
MGITDTQSFSLVIRDAFYDALAADPFFASYTCRKTKMLSVQHSLLPYLGVYIIDETMLPDGDANAGHIRFSHTLRIGFSVVIANNDQVAAELQIDAAWWRIMNPWSCRSRQAAALVRAYFDLHDVIRYVYMGEAWTLERIIRPEEQEEIYRKGIAEHPDRVEVVQLQDEDHEYGQIISARKIIRLVGGKPYLASPEMINDLPFIPHGATVQSEGRMVGMLPVRGTRQ